MPAAPVTIYGLASILFRLIGFARWADSLWHAHELRVKAREIADTPTTDAGWRKAAEEGDL